MFSVESEQIPFIFRSSPQVILNENDFQIYFRIEDLLRTDFQDML